MQVHSNTVYELQYENNFYRSLHLLKQWCFVKGAKQTRLLQTQKSCTKLSVTLIIALQSKLQKSINVVDVVSALL